MEVGLLVYTVHNRNKSRNKVSPDDAPFLLRQGTVSPWSIVPLFPRVLQVLPTMSDSSQVSQLPQSQLSDIVGSSTYNTLVQRGTMLHEDTVPQSHNIKQREHVCLPVKKNFLRR